MQRTSFDVKSYEVKIFGLELFVRVQNSFHDLKNEAVYDFVTEKIL
jgi:hypothetical protein